MNDEAFGRKERGEETENLFACLFGQEEMESWIKGLFFAFPCGPGNVVEEIMTKGVFGLATGVEKRTPILGYTPQDGIKKRKKGRGAKMKGMCRVKERRKKEEQGRVDV